MMPDSLKNINLPMQLFFQAIELHPQMICFLDEQKLIQYANENYFKVTGYSSHEILNSLFNVINPDETNHSINYQEQVWETIHTHGIWYGEHLERKKNGDVFWCKISIHRITCSEFKNCYYLVNLEDIDERKKNDQMIQHLAFYDPLTGLPNRRLFQDRLEQAVALANHSGFAFALIYLDLDNFKQINDSYGHHAGDLLLKMLSNRLIKTLRDGDTVARSGGDEFIFIINNISCLEDADIVSHRLMAQFKEPLLLEMTEISIKTSIGISIFPYNTVDKESLVKQADIALRQAKMQGKNRAQIFNDQMSSDLLENQALFFQLKDAFHKNELLLMYQPKLSLKTQSICGFEAFLRWNHPQLGWVSPMRFLPISEQSGFILELGHWILKQACLQNKKWQDMGLPAVRIAVNFSNVEFNQENTEENIVDIIKNILIETGLEAKYLEIEVTENTIMTDFDNKIKMLSELRELGVSIALDDFGTGYSSLAYLKRLPIDKLKIDGSFISMLKPHDVHDDPLMRNDNAITQAIISMAHSFGFGVIAEGVETEEQMEFLKEHECDEIQGYVFSKPLFESDSEFFLKSFVE